MSTLRDLDPNLIKEVIEKLNNNQITEALEQTLSSPTIVKIANAQQRIRYLLTKKSVIEAEIFDQLKEINILKGTPPDPPAR